MSRSTVLGILAGLMGAAGAGCNGDGAPPPVAPTPPALVDFRNGLTDDDRGAFYHLSEGSVLFPLAWFESLEQEGDLPASDTSTNFLDGLLARFSSNDRRLPAFRENLERFGFIRDPEDSPGLPIGMTVSTWENQDMIGVNCAACHVGEIHYQGKRFRVDGAPNLIRPAIDLVSALGAATDQTARSLPKAGRFLASVVAWHARRGSADHFLREAEGRLQFIRTTFFTDPELFPAIQKSQTTEAGFGRVDAFGLGRNLLFAPVGGSQNILNADAPVSIPHLWGMQHTAWLQWGANTNSVLERNIGQALITGGRFTDASMTRSTVPIDNLHTLEELAAKITAPKWPEDILGRIDQERATRGKDIYERTCASCHGRPLETTPEGLKVRNLYALNTIGTDPATAINFEKTVRLGQAGEEQPFPVAALAVIKRVKSTYYQDRGIPAAQQTILEARALRKGPRWDPTIRTTLASADKFPDTKEKGVYAAKPLAGIWATAPYLHNGSVPTLYDLLLPSSERPVSFKVGQREYDPERLGYQLDTTKIVGLPSGFRLFDFDARKPGNSNKGHEGPAFGTTLNDEDRFALLEYLKVLPPE